eukprot:scaffold187280_cov12-Tisochrysis_lutea.AAC.1
MAEEPEGGQQEQDKQGADAPAQADKPDEPMQEQHQEQQASDQQNGEKLQGEERGQQDKPQGEGGVAAAEEGKAE